MWSIFSLFLEIIFCFMVICFRNQSPESFEKSNQTLLNILKPQGQVFEKLSSNTFWEGRIRCYNCRKLCLQISMTIIFGTLQNDTWLVYIFGIFSDWCFNFIMAT